MIINPNQVFTGRELRSFAKKVRSCHLLMERDHLSIETPTSIQGFSEYTLPLPHRRTATRELEPFVAHAKGVVLLPMLLCWHVF